MARQSVTQHLSVLESANLVSTIRHGRMKLHYLNPIPLHEIQDRWIQAFEYRRHFRRWGALKHKAEETMADKPTFVYVTYIEAHQNGGSCADNADLTAKYGVMAERLGLASGDRVGTADGTLGDVADVVGGCDRGGGAASTGDLRQSRSNLPWSGSTSSRTQDIVQLTVAREGLADQDEYEAASCTVCPISRSCLETGHVLAGALGDARRDVPCNHMTH